MQEPGTAPEWVQGDALALVVFDCDGVLVDSEPISQRVSLEMIAEHGVEMEPEEMAARYLGTSDADMAHDIERRLGIAFPAGFVDEMQARKLAAFHVGVAAVDGAADAVAAIAGAAPGLCVASSGPREATRVKLESAGLLEPFDGHLFSAYDVPRGKPHPDVFLYAAARMGVEPARCAVVEDSLPGVRGAVAAGMRVLGYAPGGGGAALRDAGAEVFQHMADVPGLLGL